MLCQIDAGILWLKTSDIIFSYNDLMLIIHVIDKSTALCLRKVRVHRQGMDGVV